MTDKAPSVYSRVRLATLLPAPFCLSDYEPFVATHKSATPQGPRPRYGVSLQTDVTPARLKAMQAAMQKAFAADATTGYCLVDKVGAIFFDMDATVIVEESLVTLAGRVGKTEEVAAITERAMAGDLDFKEALTLRVKTLAGLSASVLPEVADGLTLSRGIQPFAAFCRQIGVPLFMVSGGFVQLAEPVRRKVGFAAIHANTLEESGGKLTGRVTGPVVDAMAKRDFVLATCAKLGIAPASAVAVGDGANDLLMMGAVGCAVGHKPKPVLRPHLHAQNADGDHAFLAPLLFGRDVGIVRR